MPLILVYRETFVSFAYVVNLWSCWNSGYELDIVATTRSNRVCQSFSFSLSLSTELLEDKQGFKLGGVDTSPSYLLFQTLLPLFWTLICMIWMELTRTDVVFSRIAMVLFLCRNKSSRNVLKIYGDFFSGIKEKYMRKDPPEGACEWATSPQAAATPYGRAVQACGAHVAPPPPNSALYLPSLPEKKSKRRFHRVLWYGGPATSCSSSGGQLWSPFRAPERGNRRHRHHQPLSIDNSMMLFIVHE